MIRESAIGRVMVCSQPACGNIFKYTCNPLESSLPNDGFIMDQARLAGWLVPSRDFALCPHHAPRSLYSRKGYDNGNTAN